MKNGNVNESATARPRVDTTLKPATVAGAREIGNCAPKTVFQTLSDARGDAPDISMLGAVRRMLSLATEVAFDLLDGQHYSENLDRLEALSREITRKLAAIPANDGNTDFTLLNRRGRDSFEKFNESIRSEIIESIHPGTGNEALDIALERVKNSAIAAGASLGMIELKSSNI